VLYCCTSGLGFQKLMFGSFRFPRGCAARKCFADAQPSAQTRRRSRDAAATQRLFVPGP
jgi:hypothetical protein